MSMETKAADPAGRNKTSCCGHGARDDAAKSRLRATAETPITDDRAAASSAISTDKSKGCCCNG